MQRAVIVLRAKQVDFEVTYINLRDKPDWFLEISPHGKVPVLQVDGEPLFESNAIAEYLDETIEPRLHPEDPIERARHRAWTDFVPTFSGGLGGVYAVQDDAQRAKAMTVARQRLGKLEEAIAGNRERGGSGPYFSGAELCLVDAGYAPFLQRFHMVEPIIESGLLDEFPRVAAWTEALVADSRIQNSVPENFTELYLKQIAARGLDITKARVA